MKEIVKIVFIYRALEIGETALCCMPFRGDILSEVYSRLLNTSNLYGSPSLRCFTESFKVAYEFSKKKGYSGKIAVLQVKIWTDGTCTLDDDDDALVHRLWLLVDWLDIANRACRNSAQNLNYKTESISLSSMVSFGGQRTVRGVANASKAWVVHTESTREYSRILEMEEIEVLRKKRASYPSLHCINYMFDSSICDKLLADFAVFDEHIKWVENTKYELENIKRKLWSA